MGRCQRVGVFDSGVGGLTTLAACLHENPQAEFYYLGDNEHAPYGNKSEEEIASLVRGAMTQFREMGVDAAVLACNTATTVCIREMRKEFSFPVIGTEPAVSLAAAHCREALVLATPRTARSDRLRKLIEEAPSCRFTVLPCEGLAGEIEAYLTGVGNSSTSIHLPDFGGISYDGAVLGCTHYVFFEKEIEQILGCKTFNGNRGVARRLKSVLSAGMDVHENTNICFEKKVKENGEKRVFFVGKSRFVNQRVFELNICFRNS